MIGRFEEIKKAACNALAAVALVDITVEEAKAALVLAARLLNLTMINSGVDVDLIRQTIDEEDIKRLLQRNDG